MTDRFWGVVKMADGRKVAVLAEARAIESPDEEYAVRLRTFAGMGALHRTTEEVTMDAATLAAWKKEVQL